MNKQDSSASNQIGAEGNSPATPAYQIPIPQINQKPEFKSFFASILESLEDSIIGVDLNNIIVAWNRAAERLYGYSAEEVLGKPLTLLMLPEDLHEVLASIDRVRQGEPVAIFGAHRICKDGRHIHVSVKLSPIRDAAGQLIGVSTLARDITSHRQSEESLRQSEAQFRTLAETIPQLVWTCSPEGQCDYLSPQWGAYTGIPSSDQLGRKWAEAVHPDDRPVVRERWQAGVERREPFDLEYRLRNAQGGYRWFHVRGAPVCDASGRVIKWFGTCTDIDDSKRAQDHLENLIAERTIALRETVSELEAFSYSMVHDMRAPLRAMHNFSCMLQDTYAGRLDEPGRDMLQRIANAAERLDVLIREVLRYTRVLRDKAPLSPINLDQLVRDLLTTYPDWAPPRADIHVEGPLPTVLGHQGLLTQCLSNLVENAIKFVAPGVHPRVRIWAEFRENRVRLNVQDNGIGIAPEHRPRVFRMLDRINPASEYEGTGIGLTIVRKAAQRMGGQVDFESEPGKGSTFWLELQKPNSRRHQP